MNASVCGIVVSYFPDSDRVLSLIRRLAPQVGCLVVVDNTPGNSPVLDEIPSDLNVTQLRQGVNKGVAEALNIGIRFAISRGYSHVLLSDQDSNPGSDMVDFLVSAEEALLDAGFPVAAVGPNVVNQVAGTGLKFQRRTEGWWSLFVRRSSIREDLPVTEVATLITSGTLISTREVACIGFMRSELFIDFVDIEWCLRAGAIGRRCYVVPKALLEQPMGDSGLRVWLFGWRTISSYGPVRLYYQFRNSAFLVRQSYVPLAFKLEQVLFIAAKFYAYGIFSARRRASVHMMCYGLVRGVMGRLLAPPRI